MNVALIVHGSLYPWHFAEVTNGHEAVHHFFDGPMWTGGGDVAGNVVLFAPLGALGVFWWRRTSSRIGFFACAVLLALVLQVLQAWVPSRDAVLSDAIWNVVGLVLGMISAFGGLRFTRVKSGAAHMLRPAQTALLLLWFGLEWWPFVPTLDWQHVKDALKPLLLAPRWNLHSAAEVAISVVILAYAVCGWRWSLRWLSAIVLASALAKLVIVNASLSFSHLVGYVVGLAASLGLSTSFSGRRGPPSRALAMACASLALAWFTVDEFRPYVFLAEPTRFHVMPFQQMLEGSMDANALALVWDLFWLGAVLVPAIELGAQPAAFAIGLGVWVVLLETLQRWLPGRSADITPALLPLIWVMLLPKGRHRVP